MQVATSEIGCSLETIGCGNFVRAGAFVERKLATLGSDLRPWVVTFSQGSDAQRSASVISMHGGR